MKTITKKEIDSLYRKVGLSGSGDSPSQRLNKGTLNNKLAFQFKGARNTATMKGTIK